MINKVTGAAEGEGFKKLLEAITSVISGLERAINLYNSLPDFGKLLVNPLSAISQIPKDINNVKSLVKSQPTTVNNYNIKGAVDPQATARVIVKVQNTALATTGLRAFAN